MSTKRILFVDDESSILEGLANLLRKQRKRWQMTFALGAEAALEELGKEPFDVVVSDMRMPGMDGAALLARVKEQCPGTARIILSGHAEREAVIKALGVAHQFLSKPCNGDALVGVIERTCRLQELLQDAAVRAAIGQLDCLPSAPATYLELVRVASDPNAGLPDLTRVVERDTAMAVKVLQLVNSAFFGLAHPMASVAKAVNYLGVDLLKGLALNLHVFGQAAHADVPGFSTERLQEQALLCGRLAGRFVREKKDAEAAMTSALVKDAGKLVLCQARPEAYARIVAEAAASGEPLHAVEQRVLGLTHAEVGAYLLGVWGLPFTVVEAVAFHRRPGLVSEGPREVLAAVHVAAALVDESEHAPAAIELDFLRAAGLEERLVEWRRIAAQELESVASRK